MPLVVTARYALDEACVDASIPFVTGSAVGVRVVFGLKIRTNFPKNYYW